MTDDEKEAVVAPAILSQSEIARLSDADLLTAATALSRLARRLDGRAADLACDLAISMLAAGSARGAALKRLDGELP